MKNSSLKQDINLFESFRAPPPLPSFLTWKVFCISIVFFIFYFFVLTGISWLDAYSLSKEKIALTQQAKQLETNFYALKSKYPAFFFSKDVNETLKTLQQNVNFQADILASVIQKKYFSDDLLIIARSIPQEVWLTTINIKQSGTELSLKGHALSLNALQLFLGNLLKEKVYLKYKLDIKTIEQVNNMINFEITLVS